MWLDEIWQISILWWAGKKIRRYLIEVEKRFRNDKNDISKIKSMDWAMSFIINNYTDHRITISDLRKKLEEKRKEELNKEKIIRNLNKKLEDYKKANKLLEVAVNQASTVITNYDNRLKEKTEEKLFSMDEVWKKLWVSRWKIFSWLKESIYITTDNKPNKRHKNKFFKLVNCNWYKKLHANSEGLKIIERLYKKKIICV